MPDFNSQPAGGPEGALAWYNQSLAKVLGLNPADPTLAADQLSELATAAQRQALAKVIDGRFTRRVDDETGAVTIDQVGDPLVLVEPDDEVDPVLGGIAANYLDAARTAIGEIDTGQCVPGACPDQVAGIVAQIRSTIDILAAEAPRRRSMLQMYLHLDELTNVNCGLLGKLNKLFNSRSASGVRTVERERALAAIRVAQRAISSFEAAMCEVIADDDEPTLTEVAKIVRGCGAHIAAQVHNVRQQLRRAGIGDCEVQAIQLKLNPAIILNGESFELVSFDQALNMLATEPARWERLLGSGQDGFAAISGAAETLRPIVDAIDPVQILKDLGILPDGPPSESRDTYAAELSFGMDRMTAYAQAVLGRIIDETPGGGTRPAPARRAPPPKTPPPGDVAPMK
jgi:hypothetical protein